MMCAICLEVFSCDCLAFIAADNHSNGLSKLCLWAYYDRETKCVWYTCEGIFYSILWLFLLNANFGTSYLPKHCTPTALFYRMVRWYYFVSLYSSTWHWWFILCNSNGLYWIFGKIFLFPISTKINKRPNFKSPSVEHKFHPMISKLHSKPAWFLFPRLVRITKVAKFIGNQ